MIIVFTFAILLLLGVCVYIGVIVGNHITNKMWSSNAFTNADSVIYYDQKNFKVMLKKHYDAVIMDSKRMEQLRKA